MTPTSHTGPTTVGIPTPTNPNPGPLLVDDREAARMLGVSSRTIWTMRSDGRLPTVGIGRAKRIPVAALHAFARTVTIGGAA